MSRLKVVSAGKPLRADRIIDGRQLEPPEPFIQTMEALDAIQPGQCVLLILMREPFPLYRALELTGYAWRTGRSEEGGFEVLMWHKTKPEEDPALV